MERIEYEKNYLKEVMARIQEEITAQNQSLIEIPNQYKNRYSDVKWGDEDLVETLITSAKNRINKLNLISRNPYFGRIDFLESGSSKELRLYIGKTAILKKDGELLTIDWRSPISTLYYDQSIGAVSYDSPDGISTGNMTLKSQILISDGEIISINDTDLVSNDELLKPYLSVSADSRMRDIVASIQYEQNSIIRKSISEDLIIQGSAGSGKTSIALHRIAYLIYNYNKKIKSNQFMVIGPNKYFINYISSLLPDLEVESVQQLTFGDLFSYLTDEKIKIKDQTEELKNYLKHGKTNEILKFKSSLEYKFIVELFIEYYINKMVANNLDYECITLCDKSSIRECFENQRYTIGENIDILIKKIIARTKDRAEDYYNKIYNQNYRQEIINLPNSNPRKKELIDKTNAIKSELKSGCAKYVRSYFKIFNDKILNIYKEFIENIELFLPENVNFDKELFKKQTLQSINKKTVEYEDLPALMYLYIKFKGNKTFEEFIHVAIDEAQDYGLFHIYVMKTIFKNAHFSIYGDLAQSIYGYRCLQNWDELNCKVFNNKCEIINLNKSYRTTIEIMDAANSITRYLNLNEAVPVARHGEVVSFDKIPQKERKSFYIQKILSDLEKGYKTIAIICKNEEEAEKLYKELNGCGINITKICCDDDQYIGGVCILTSYLSKGLEFDSVIINDASSKSYDENKKIDMMMLYVALTRPLHKLEILSTGDLTKPLADYVQSHKGTENNKIKIKK